jgi:hypothetical protein
LTDSFVETAFAVSPANLLAVSKPFVKEVVVEDHSDFQLNPPSFPEFVDSGAPRGISLDDSGGSTTGTYAGPEYGS